MRWLWWFRVELLLWSLTRVQVWTTWRCVLWWMPWWDVYISNTVPWSEGRRTERKIPVWSLCPDIRCIVVAASCYAMPWQLPVSMATERWKWYAKDTHDQQIQTCVSKVCLHMTTRCVVTCLLVVLLCVVRLEVQRQSLFVVYQKAAQISTSGLKLGTSTFSRLRVSLWKIMLCTGTMQQQGRKPYT